MSLPTREEMFTQALAAVHRAHDALDEASAALNSDWRPIGSSLTEEQAVGRADARRAIGAARAALGPAERALQAAGARGAVR